MTPEEGEDSGWEETDEVIESDEEREDRNKPGDPARFNEKEMFQRVTSMPNLVSRCSLLTTLIHDNDRAAIHRPRTPNGSIVPSPRKNMISKELTGSLRNDLLRERRVKSSTFNAVQRRHTAHDINNLPNYPNENGNSCSNHFDEGYHHRGW